MKKVNLLYMFLVDGTLIDIGLQNLKVGSDIYTPGHAGDHVAFYNKQTGHMFTGDLFVARKTKVMMDIESIPVTMDFLRKLLTMILNQCIARIQVISKMEKEN